MKDVKNWMITGTVRNMTYGNTTDSNITECIDWLSENWDKIDHRVKEAVLYDIRMHKDKDERFKLFVEKFSNNI